jgi:hypothetical protein
MHNKIKVCDIHADHTASRRKNYFRSVYKIPKEMDTKRSIVKKLLFTEVGKQTFFKFAGQPLLNFKDLVKKSMPSSV